jgi:hypothetical protein
MSMELDFSFEFQLKKYAKRIAKPVLHSLGYIAAFKGFMRPIARLGSTMNCRSVDSRVSFF